MKSKRGTNIRWCETEFDRDEPRKRFRRALMKAASEFARHQRCNASIVTPYWKSSFIDWLVYDGTLGPCGARVESITPDSVRFAVNCSGVQTEGICLSVTFDIPTKEFTRAQLGEMVHDFEYHPARDAKVEMADGTVREGFNYGPFDETKYITELEWWYDQSYDEGVDQ